MVDFDKKKRPNDFSMDFDRLDEIVNRIMGQLVPELPTDSKQPVVFGFSMRMDNEGKPLLEEFGNVSKKAIVPSVEKAREPLVDLRSDEKNLFITVELPGVEKTNLKINVPDSLTLEIIVIGNTSFYKKLQLPFPVLKEKSNAKLKNGILEIVFEKEKIEPEKESQISIN